MNDAVSNKPSASLKLQALKNNEVPPFQIIHIKYQYLCFHMQSL